MPCVYYNTSVGALSAEGHPRASGDMMSLIRSGVKNGEVPVFGISSVGILKGVICHAWK